MQIQPEELLTRPCPTRANAPPSFSDVRLDLAAEVLRRFSELRFVARGGSMIPSIYPGDLLTVRAQSIDDVRRGQIVLCLRDGRFYAHRIIRKWNADNRLLVTTRGDALTDEDAAFDQSQLLGSVISVTRCGKPIDVPDVENPWARLLCMGARNSTLFANALLGLHSLRMRLLRCSSDLLGCATAQVPECM